MAQRLQAAPAARLLLALLTVAALLMAALCGPRAAALAASGDSQYQQGIVAAKAGQYSAAAHDFEQAILKGHNDPDTFYQLGLAYSKLKRWNYAMWAVAMALTDTVFYDTHPKAQTALDAAQNAGGVNAGPPPLLQNATVKPMKAPPVKPAEFAAKESQAAVSALESGAYFVSPEFALVINFRTAGDLSAAAEEAATNSNTTVKFVYLGATPAPFTDLQQYARDFFSHLNLQRAVLVVITPQAAAAYSDRLDSGVAARLVAQQRGLTHGDPLALATGIARAVVRQADDNDNAATHRSVAIGAAIIIAILAAVGLGIWRVGWSSAAGARRHPVRRAGTAARPRPR